MENTFSHQSKLPEMPVPELTITFKKLIEWAEPLLTESELNEAKIEVDKFLEPGGEGEKLQKNLIEWAQESTVSNWSAPVWKNIYLDARHSLTINSNVFYYLKSKLDEKSNSQAHIAAALTATVYDFIGSVDNELLSVDMQKDRYLCMNQYKNIFSSVRIPCVGSDQFKVSKCRKSIIVLHNQKMFQVDILDESGRRRVVPDIEHDLQLILSIGDKGQNFGLLTTTPRESWAFDRKHLLDISENNQRAMQIIEDAAFVLCLDNGNPDAITDISKQLLHGGGEDRYFDKALQFVVFNNGKTGINFEHTGVDGSVMLRMIGHIYNSIDKVSVQEGQVNKLVAKSDARLQEIEFYLDETLVDAIQNAKNAFHQHVENTQTRVLSFSHFGKDRIKQFGVSPDAFVQLALQLAEFKLYGKFFSAYEAVMTRTFLDGRIDVLYTVSPESSAFVKSLVVEDQNVEISQDLLRKAAQQHVNRAKECRFGEGVYSHCLALQHRYKKAGKELGIDAMPSIFNSHVYKALTNSVVCTSTTSDYGVELAGYGPIVDNGYGIRYFIRNDSICFNMTSRTALSENLDKMHRYIEQSLVEMGELMETGDT
ncbi:choline/carnitine O-acyltransferase [Vibrio hannami]|uniref:choline/carnitine O-acyltransferase n=1 Tax=Vibrio hannami TaxID=2717094 RepID=UPI002410376F|nr:choline/carnitine O-acyltransferase [Vibrio hannami]MDG3084923.1 choline/carnitine O-acyltransferase [Vibrio hannami]